MKRLPIILGFIISLGLAMPLAVHAQEESGPPAKKEAPSAEEGGGKKSKGDKDITGGRFAGDPIFVHISPLILTVINANGVEQIITVVITLEISDVEGADDIHKNMPKVRDALMRSLYGGLGNGSLRNGNLVDVDKIKNKTFTAMDDLLGAGKIKNVLIEGVSQRML